VRGSRLSCDSALSSTTNRSRTSSVRPHPGATASFGPLSRSWKTFSTGWPFPAQVVGLAALAMVVGSARGCAPSPDAPGSERGHHVDDDAGHRLVVVREEHPEACTRFLRRNGLPPVFAEAPAIEHRLVAPVADGHAVHRRPVCWEVVPLAFEHPEDGVSEVLVSLVVCRSSDLVVLLGIVFGFLEDCRKIGFSHYSTEVRTRLRPSGGAEKL
jgi:hypothetical protein